MMGAIAMTDAADNFAQNNPSGLDIDAISQDNVPALAALKLSDQNDSFHAQTMQTKAVDAMPPLDNGKIT